MKTTFRMLWVFAGASILPLAGAQSEYLFIGRDFRFDAQREQAVKNLTVEQVNAAMKKYLDYSRIISVKAGDFAKAAAK